jgi:hypothetical protein
MTAVKLRAARNFPIDGKQIAIGDVFDCDDKRAGELLSFGLVEPADDATAERLDVHRLVPEWIEALRAPVVSAGNWVTRK